MNTPQSCFMETEVSAMSYTEFCYAYWKKGYQYPYPVPSHQHPSPAASYHEYLEVRRSMGSDDDFAYDRGQNLLRACYEYLAGSEGKLVSLSEMLTFLSAPPQQVLTTLAEYQPVYGWLLKAELLLEGTITDDVFCLHRVEGATERARYCVQECMNFPAKQQQLQQEAAQQAEAQRELTLANL